MSSSLQILLAFCLTWILVSSDTYKSVMWTSNNPLFTVQADNSACEIGDPLLIKVKLKSILPIVCPFEFIIMQTLPSKPSTGVLHENIWIVYDRKSFDTCIVNTTVSVNNQKNKKLYECSTPKKLVKFTHDINFKGKGPVDSGIHFSGGNTYYFLTTSDGTIGSLNDTAGGHCYDNSSDTHVRMKFMVYVCKDDEDPQCKNSKIGEFMCSKSSLIPTTSSPVTTNVVPTTSGVNISTTSQVNISTANEVNISTTNQSLVTTPPTVLDTTIVASTTSEVPTINTTAANTLATGAAPPQISGRTDLTMKESRDNWRIVAIFFFVIWMMTVLIMFVCCYKSHKKKHLSTCLSDINKVSVPPLDTPPYEGNKDRSIDNKNFTYYNMDCRVDEEDGQAGKRNVIIQGNVEMNSLQHSPDEGVDVSSGEDSIRFPKQEQPTTNNQSNGTSSTLPLNNVNTTNNNAKQENETQVDNDSKNASEKPVSEINKSPKKSSKKNREELPKLKLVQSHAYSNGKPATYINTEEIV